MPRSQNCQARGKWAPPWPPRRGWQDKTALRLKDNEIIFNLCPLEALPAPVILDGTVREGGVHIHTKPGNYCTNYSLLMRVGEWVGRGGGILRALVQVNNSAASAPAEAGATRCWTVVPLLFPSQIFDLLSCLQSVLLGKEGAEEGGGVQKNSPETFNCSTEAGVRSAGSAICSCSHIAALPQ